MTIWDGFGDVARDASDVAAAVRALSAGAQATGAIRGWLDTRRAKRDSPSEFLRALRVSPASLRQIVLPYVHPVGGRSPRARAQSDIIALEALLGSDLLEAMLAIETLPSDLKLAPETDLDVDLLLIGSPEVQPLAALLFGYRFESATFGMKDTNSVRLPYRWDESEQASRYSYCIQRRKDNRILIRPNWPRIKKTGDEEERKYPELDSDHFLAEDFLLITTFPNLFSRAAYQSGRSVLHVAGLHGVATRSVELLADEQIAKSVLAEASPMLRKSRWIQMLFRVSDIDHDSYTGSIARSISLVEVIEIPLSHQESNEAIQRIEEEFPAWSRAIRLQAEAPDRGPMGFELAPGFKPEDSELLQRIVRSGEWPMP